MVVKKNGNGTLAVKTWFGVISMIAFFISVGFNGAHMVGITGVKERLLKLERKVENHVEKIHIAESHFDTFKAVQEKQNEMILKSLEKIENKLNIRSKP